MTVIFLGPPGSGKGTQAKIMQGHLGVPAISTGDMLREAMQKKTELGIKAKKYITAGQLVPDEVVTDLVALRLGEEDCRRGFLLDGYPRTINQALALQGVLGTRRLKLDVLVFFDVDEKEILARLGGRRVCRQCGSPFHVELSPPVLEGICDSCGGALFQREDDRESTVKERLKVYASETEPLIDFYTKEGCLKRLKAKGKIEDITGELLNLLGHRAGINDYS